MAIARSGAPHRPFGVDTRDLRAANAPRRTTTTFRLVSRVFCMAADTGQESRRAGRSRHRSPGQRTMSNKRPPLRGYLGATACFPERRSPQSQPCRAVQRGCFLLITNSRPRRRTRIAPSLAASDRNEFRFFREIPFPVGSNAGSPRSARFAELDVPAHGRVVLAQHEPVGVVAPALRSHVRGTGALATNQPDDSSRASVVGHAYLPRATSGNGYCFQQDR